ncbi:MAG: tetratricopeptide repeat protein [Gammaproteobacteria bacterium]
MNRIFDTRFQARGIPLALTLMLLWGCAGNTGSRQNTNYEPDASYHLLMAEIALERSEFLIAAREYLRAAEESADLEVARRSTEFAFNYGFDTYALNSANRWQELDPENPITHSYLGRLYFRFNDLDRAYRQYDLALGPEVERVDADYLTLAGDLAGEGKPRRALVLVERFTEANSSAPGAWLALANTAMQAADAEFALESASRAFDLAPDWDQAQVAVARALLLSGETAAALDLINELLERVPSLELELEYVRLLAAAGETVEAIERLDGLAGQYGDQPEILRTRGIINLQAGELDAAWRNYSQLLSAGFNINESFYYLGRIAFERQRYMQSARLHARIVSGRFLVPAQLSISQAYTLLGDPETGLIHLRQFAELYPKHAFEIMPAEARLLVSMDRSAEALEVYDRALLYKPNTESLLLARGSLLESDGDLNDALNDFRRAVDITPDSALALNALGYTLANRTKRYREAHRYIKRALELDPDNAAIIDSMGWVQYRRGRLPDALTYLERAYELMPDPEISAHLGEVLWAHGDLEAAKQIWGQALQEHPDSPVLNETVLRFNP